ncbi:MAG: exodeoxyribonuclease VII small subunit [Planctomycetota bacterium]
MPDETADSSGSKPLSFEQAIEKLESMIDDIESGEVGLEEAISRYEQGQQLVKRCRTILDKAEQRIAELTPDNASPDTDVDE